MLIFNLALLLVESVRKEPLAQGELALLIFNLEGVSVVVGSLDDDWHVHIHSTHTVEEVAQRGAAVAAHEVELLRDTVVRRELPKALTNTAALLDCDKVRAGSASGRVQV